MERTQPDDTRGSFRSRKGFVLAAAGSAIGLGNIWKFPYITGENGGGLFVLIYLACIAFVGVPLLAAEILIGRAAKKQPVGAYEALQGRPTAWTAVGWLGVVAAFLVLSYYMVVAGWTMDYTVKSIAQFTAPLDQEAREEAARYRATARMEEIRELLAEELARDAVQDAVREIQGRLPPSAHADLALFEAAVEGVADPEAARAALLGEPEVRARIEAARANHQLQAAARASAHDEAQATLAAWPETRLRAEAETVIRRRGLIERAGASFARLHEDGWTSCFWAALFMGITVLVVGAGISGGIERWCGILMPLLLLLIVVMVVYGAFQPGFGPALRFVFLPDVHRLQPSGVLEALGHAFFTLSLGVGGMITYGSYQRTREHLGKQALTIAGLDTLVALLACLMMFPILFSHGAEPAAGPGLVFISMPVAFAQIGSGGMLLSILFFGLLVFAALTSSISLLEIVTSYSIDQLGVTRRRAAWVNGALIFLFGCLCCFAASPGFVLSSWQPTYRQDFFTTMDYLVTNWLLPLGGLFISVYAGWFLPRRFIAQEMEGVAAFWVSGWLVLVRTVTPLLVILVLLQKVGILDANELFFRLR